MLLLFIFEISLAMYRHIEKNNCILLDSRILKRLIFGHAYTLRDCMLLFIDL